MEAIQRKKFICKFCNKRYPCGKSLGGHIRIHLNGNGNSDDVDQKAAANNLNASKIFAVSNNGWKSKRESEAGEGGGEQSGYGLRENPKKTNRSVLDSKNTNLLQEKVCKECGKGFQSLKALCGHMACHSKNNSCLEVQSGTSEKLKELIMDYQSDTETSAPSKGKRSKRLRYKTIGVFSSSLSLANGSVSSASDVEQEQEEVAMSLMMLSRDSSFKGCFSFVADSSENNSVILEAKSSSTKMRISVKRGGNFEFDGKEFSGMKESRQREQLVAAENDDSDNSDSGYFRNGPKKVESDISVHRFSKNCEFKKHKMEFGSSLDQDSDVELGKRLSSFRRIKARYGRNSVEENGYALVDKASTKYDSKRRVKNESGSSEIGSGNAAKRGRYFSLEGDRTSHKKTNGHGDSIYESGENSIDNDYIPRPLPSHNKKILSCSEKSKIEHNSSGKSVKKLGTKRGKVHECPFCSKVFQSGQALGGHKRSHFVGAGEDRTLVINQEMPEIPMPTLIDLNLPAPTDEEEEANGYIPW